MDEPELPVRPEPLVRPATKEESDALGLTRRGFSIGAAGITSTAALVSCRKSFPPQAPKGERRREVRRQNAAKRRAARRGDEEPVRTYTRKQGARTFTMRAKVLPGQYRSLRALLDDPTHNPFQTSAAGIHYARLFTTDEHTLYFMVIYDDYMAAFDFLSANADGVDRVLGHCQGYPAAGAKDKPALIAYVEANFVDIQLYYRAYNTAQAAIRDNLTLRDEFLKFLKDTTGVSQAALRKRYAEFLQSPHMRNYDRIRSNDVSDEDLTSSRDIPLAPVGPDRVAPFTLLARLEDKKVKKVKRLLRLGTWATIDLGARPLKKLSTLHFARVSIVNGNYMLFASVYDGDFMQYVEDFGTRIAKQIDTIFGACVGYPKAGAADVFQFKDFLAARQVPTSAFGGSYLDRSLLQIQASLRLTQCLGGFTRRVDAQHRRLVPKLDKFLHRHQDLLT